MTFPVPVLGIVACGSGSGKTTLLRQIIPQLSREGLRVGLIKHAHHTFEPDIPGKDSYLLRQAGARQVLVVSRERMALFSENPEGEELDLEHLVQLLASGSLNLVLVEGLKQENVPKIEVYRPTAGFQCQALYPLDPWIIAVATDADLEIDPGRPVLELNSPDQVVTFILDWLKTCVPCL